MKRALLICHPLRAGIDAASQSKTNFKSVKNHISVRSSKKATRYALRFTLLRITIVTTSVRSQKSRKRASAYAVTTAVATGQSAQEDAAEKVKIVPNLMQQIYDLNLIKTKLVESIKKAATSLT
nr:hypothetical protein [Vibrio anguillarum]